MTLQIEPIVEVDTSAWPSSYGRGKRVDLEKFFEKVQQQQQEQQMLEQQQRQDSTIEGESGTHRRVRFSTEPPTVFVYEAEYDTFDRLVSSIEQSKDTWPSYARRPPTQLDLRPIRNHQYRTPPPPCIDTTFTTTTTTTTTASIPRRSSSLSTKSTGSSTPPLSPPCLSSGMNQAMKKINNRLLLYF